MADLLPDNVVGSLGLVLDIVGAALIWKYGLPAKVDREGRSHLLLQGVDEDEIAKAKRYDRLSR